MEKTNKLLKRHQELLEQISNDNIEVEDKRFWNFIEEMTDIKEKLTNQIARMQERIDNTKINNCMMTTKRSFEECIKTLKENNLLKEFYEEELNGN